MVRAAVPEQHEIGDPMLAQELIKEHWPLGEAAAEIDGRIGPVAYVASIDVDAVDDVTLGGERSADTAEERTWRSLKE